MSAFKRGEQVCVYCGRRGTRGFAVSSGSGDGSGDGTGDTYRCANYAARDRRQAARSVLPTEQEASE